MPDASPAKWHLAHTTWFFETFVLRDYVPGYEAFNPAFGFLFNSYYEAEGPRHTRAARGLLARPALDEIHGKFMSGQHVLKCASCATPSGSSRASYRNFFYAPQRWQFTGLRLARDL